MFAVAKRSPILGYNHNIRHRGVVFHVQTEDSGVANPHIYTHLFHGGVIITTRKLVYDAEAAEDVVKALMQAQHKAIMKELKAGAFDEKITLYLADNDELLPAGKAASTAAETPPPAAEANAVPGASEPAVEAVAEPALAADTTPVAVEDALPAEHEIARAPAVPAGPAPAEPAPAEPGSVPAAAAGKGRPIFPEPTDEPDTEPFPRISEPVQWKESGAADRPFLRAGRDVSAAIDAIVDAEDESSGTPSEITDDVASIHASAPPSTPDPPGLRKEARPGHYLQAKRAPRTQPPAAAPRVSFRSSSGSDQVSPTPPPASGRTPTRENAGRVPTREDLGRAPTRENLGPVRTREGAGRTPTREKVGRTSTREDLGRAPTRENLERPPAAGSGNRAGADASPSQRVAGARSRPAAASGRAARAQTQERVARPTAPRRGDRRPAGEAAAPDQPAERGSSRPRAKTSRGVVVSRPAVIVGAPPQVVGAKSGPQRRAPRVRKAQTEEKGDSLFGKGLISEKSLDEVILAYLSDDTSEE